jgi:sugar-specific transcriptional regulator TrmB
MFDTNLLEKAGLTRAQIDVYFFLLKNTGARAGLIAQSIGRPRGVAYKALDDLLLLGLVEKKERRGKVAIFQALHPSSLERLFEEKIKEDKKSHQEFIVALPDFVSQYNLSLNKPGVRFYEGLEGVKRVIDDNLKSKNVVYTYADMEEVDKYIKEINAQYAKKRDRLKLEKKILLVDSDYTKKVLENYEKSHIEIKFVKRVTHFATIMQIYDDKISYVTLLPNKMMGIIIQDKSIYAMHKALFESMWENASN